MQLGGVSPLAQLRLNIRPLLLVRVSGIKAFLAQPFGLLLQARDPLASLFGPTLHGLPT